jgi:hypothetical protein
MICNVSNCTERRASYRRYLQGGKTHLKAKYGQVVDSHLILTKDLHQ